MAAGKAIPGYGIADDIECMWVLFPAGDNRRERLREIARAVRALGTRLEKALSLLEGPEPKEDWSAWRSRSVFFARLPVVAPAADQRIETPDGNSTPARNSPGHSDG